MNEGTEDDDLITCWCGAKGTYKQLFDEYCLEETCDGSRTLNCYCGGDFCCCHWHGYTDCPGCEDCQLDGCEDDPNDEEQP